MSDDRAHARHEASWASGPPDGVDPGAVEEEALRVVVGLECPHCGNDDTSAMRVDQEGLSFNGYEVRCNVPDNSNDGETCEGLIYQRDFNDREA